MNYIMKEWVSETIKEIQPFIHHSHHSVAGNSVSRVLKNIGLNSNTMGSA